MTTHTLTLQSHEVLGRLSRRRDVRIWFNAYGRLCGVVRSNTGAFTYAVGHNPAGKTIVFKCEAPADNWGYVR